MTAAAEASLGELGRDALTEIANIGVSRGAALIGEREVDGLAAVRQSFAGAFSGPAPLTVPQGEGPELVRAVAGADVPFRHIDVHLRERDLRGHIAMSVDPPSLSALQALVGGSIARVLAEDGGVA